MNNSLKILVLGATGFVGAAITHRLIEAGHQVICGVRNVELTKQTFPQASFIHCDFQNDTHMSTWLPRLKQIDVIINCVGIFYHHNKKIMWALHYETPKALFKAAEKTNVKKIIHLSALGVERYDTEYAKSKRATEDFLNSLTIPHVILKPSFIYGPNSGGGMSLLRKLSATPGLILLPGKGNQKFQPICVEDLAEAMAYLTDTVLTTSITLAAVSSQQISLKSILLHLRKWLGIKGGIFFPIPMMLIKLIARLGNYVPYSTINTDAISMLEGGNITSFKEGKKFQAITGITPISFKEGLALAPATPEDKWQAHYFYLKPLLRLSLAAMWLGSAFTSAFLYPHHASLQLLGATGLASKWQSLFLYSAITLNTLLGLGLVMNYKTKINCLIQLVLVFVYTLIISFKLPYLWIEPFGPILKNIPILISIMILYSWSERTSVK